MCNAGFKAIARRLSVGHAFVHPIRWNCPVEVFGRRIEPGQLIHADKHGFLAIPFGEEKGLLEAARFMDANECNTVIPAARGTAGLSKAQILRQMDAAGAAFGKAAKVKFRRRGEW
jgi:regulator of RNase E activity RraA